MTSNQVRAVCFAPPVSLAIVLLVSLGLAAPELAAQPNGPGTWKKELAIRFETRIGEAYGNVQCVAFSPDGKLLAAGETGGAVRLWDLATGKERAKLYAGRGDICSVAFSPSGELVVAGNQGITTSTVRVWSVSTGKELDPFPGPHFSVKSFAFSPDGRFLAGGGSAGRGSTGFTGAASDAYPVKVWDVPTRKEMLQLTPEFTGSGLLLFLADNRTLIVPCPNGMVGLWDVTIGKKVREFQALGDTVWGLALDGKAVVVRSRFRSTGTATGKKRIEPDSKTLAAANPKTVLLYNLETGKLQQTIESGERVDLLAVAGNKILLAAGSDNSQTGDHPCLRWWDISTGKQRGSSRGDIWWNDRLTLSPDGQRIAVGTGTHVVNKNPLNFQAASPVGDS